MERGVQGRGQLQMRVRDWTHGAVFEAHTHAFERTAELQVHRSRRGGLAAGHLESEVAARNRGGCSGLSSPARRLNKARQVIGLPPADGRAFRAYPCSLRADARSLRE